MGKKLIDLEYDAGYADAIQFLFSKSTGICWHGCEDNPKHIEPIYIKCDELDFNDHCCLNCHGDNHAGDYNGSQGKMKRIYVESKYGLIIFYACCEHQYYLPEDLRLLKILDKYIEKRK